MPRIHKIPRKTFSPRGTVCRPYNRKWGLLREWLWRNVTCANCLRLKGKQ